MAPASVSLRRSTRTEDAGTSGIGSTTGNMVEGAETEIRSRKRKKPTVNKHSNGKLMVNLIKYLL